MNTTEQTALALGIVLGEYRSVHDRIFKFSIRRLLPVPFLFEPTPYAEHAERLVAIARALDQIFADVALKREHTDTEVHMLRYISALSKSVEKLHSLCSQLARKADGEPYPLAEYRRDLREYEESRDVFSAIGDELNQAFHNS